jgi:hypothetical protein
MLDKRFSKMKWWFFLLGIFFSNDLKLEWGVRMFINKLYELWVQWERKRSGDKRQEQPIRERLATRLRTALFDTFGPRSIQTGSTRPTFFRCVPADIRDRWRHMTPVGAFSDQKTILSLVPVRSCCRSKQVDLVLTLWLAEMIWKGTKGCSMCDEIPRMPLN